MTTFGYCDSPDKPEKPATVDERIVECREKHPDWTLRRISGAVKCNLSFVRWVLSERQKDHLISPSVQVSLEEISKAYDVLGAVKAVLQDLPNDKFIEEAELVSRVCQGRASLFKDALYSCPEIGQYRVKLQLGSGLPKWYWGKADDVARAKEIIEPWMKKS